ncbi:hypothetical protein N431DRAFT_427920 [Stipitochalara longipes BDJ]|nr:hypothetical protein N431DRAFT_427920 [Stipitochalara longipes BDJ]
MPATSILEIKAPASKIFDVIVDLKAYDEWLPTSTSFPGITSISESPAQLGTTYVESTPSGIRHGEVIGFSRPSKVMFHQPMQLNSAPQGVLVDIKVEVILREKSEGTTEVERNVYLGFPEPLSELKPVFENGASGEGARVMDLLKQRVETLP